MTFRLDKDALKYNDMKYIVDSGASTFNSKGFTLYTVQGNLRADLAVANKEFCVQNSSDSTTMAGTFLSHGRKAKVNITSTTPTRSHGMIIICTEVYLMKSLVSV